MSKVERSAIALVPWFFQLFLRLHSQYWDDMALVLAGCNRCSLNYCLHSTSHSESSGVPSTGDMWGCQSSRAMMMIIGMERPSYEKRLKELVLVSLG